MAAPKYKHYYRLMRDKNSELFAKFKLIHDGFAQEPSKWYERFHTVGRDVLDVIRDWERRLCYGSEKGQYAKYSAKLADKFWAEVRHDFRLIDQVGLIKKKADR